MRNTNILLALIFAALVGVLGVAIHDANQSPSDKIADGVSEMTEEIGDEIDDATTN